MSVKPALICGNWGGTSLRIYCLDEKGNLCRDIRYGKGINQIPKLAQKQHWFELTDDLPAAHHFICGSAGSNLGWLETGYVGLPATLNSVSSSVQWLDFNEGRVGIVPGIKAINPLSEPDTMRSEETEVLGWLAINETSKNRVLCLPGTHNKWVMVEAGAIQQFFTSLTGETFHALNTGTVITRGATAPSRGEAFDQGVSLGLKPEGTLLQKLYSVRARQIDGVLSAQDSSSFMSGLLIGTDIQGAKAHLGDALLSGVTIIGGDTLSESFERALSIAAIPSEQVSSDEVCIAGFAAIGRMQGLLG